MLAFAAIQVMLSAAARFISLGLVQSFRSLGCSTQARPLMKTSMSAGTFDSRQHAFSFVTEAAKYLNHCDLGLFCSCECCAWTHYDVHHVPPSC